MTPRGLKLDGDADLESHVGVDVLPKEEEGEYEHRPALCADRVSLFLALSSATSNGNVAKTS